MNKLFKYILIGIAIFSVGIASVKADSYVCSPYFVGGNDSQVSPGTLGMRASYDNVETTRFCFTAITDGVQYSLDNSNRTSLPKYNAVCLNKDEFGSYTSFYWKGDSSRETVYWSRFKGDCFNYTSLECQTEYNLIPISEVTTNYCALNFGMIDPQECPINSGTGAIVRSNLMINDVPYAQNQNINVFIPDFLAWNISFNDLYTVIEVEGYNADTDYIENVINQEKLTPTPEEFGKLLQGLVNFIPYLFIGLLILYFVKVLNKVWK